MVQKFRYPLLFTGMLALLAALWGGLLRMGWQFPVVQPNWIAQHGVLMVAGFFGTLIHLERAVALGKGWAYVGVAINAIGALLLTLHRFPIVGAFALVLGSLLLLLIFAAALRAHLNEHTLVMAGGALSLAIGNILWVFGTSVYQLVLWWAAFLVLTIAGERLEMTRMLNLGAPARRLFRAALLLYALGLLGLFVDTNIGARLNGIGSIALAVWLLRNDIARRTIRQTGITRFIAICLLSGYVWLLIAGGLSLIYGIPAGGASYDAMLHAIFLGFVFSMIFGHAPIIFPAVLGLQVVYTRWFYLPLGALHSALLIRTLGDLTGNLPARQWGGLLNALIIVLYLGMLLLPTLAARLRNR
ncbi:MAG: hypothetical protein OHK0052_20700 [Anaerolineales bacterium]